MTSSMAWHPLPQSGGAMSAGDEFFDDQTVAGGSLWSFGASDGQDNFGGAYPGKHGHDDALRASEEQSDEGPAPSEEPRFAPPTEDVFLGQFSDEEMLRMDVAPFEALDMFPDSMHRLLSYENMLTGVLAGSDEGDTTLDRDGVDAMDTCGFPLFSHNLQNGPRNPEQSPTAELLSDPPSEPEDDKAGLSMTGRTRAITDAGCTPGSEALVLEELEDVVFQLTKRTRICYRDAFYRLAQSSEANCRTAKMSTETGAGSSEQSFQQPGGNASRFSSTQVGCHERKTNPMDRTVMVLTLNPPRRLDGTCFSDDWGPEAQSRTGWTTRV